MEQVKENENKNKNKMKTTTESRGVRKENNKMKTKKINGKLKLAQSTGS